MRPLSALKFIASNPKKTLPFVVSLAISVFLVYFFSLYAETTSLFAYKLNVNEFKDYINVWSNDGNALPQSFLDGLKTCGDVSETFASDYSSVTNYSNGMGSYSFYAFRIPENRLDEFLKNENIKLVSGRLPRQDEFEIALPARCAAQLKVKVGDYIGTAVSDYCYLSGKYKICGIIDGDSIFAVTSRMNDDLKSGKYSVMIHLKNGEGPQIKSLLSALPSSVRINDYETNKSAINSDLTSIGMCRIVITILMIVVLCITLTNLNSILFRNRMYEFGVLSAIGYKKSRLVRKLWKEILVSCIAGYVIGIVFTTLSAELLNLTINKMKGKELCIYSGTGLLSALIVPFVVSVVSLLPCVTSRLSVDSLQGT